MGCREAHYFIRSFLDDDHFEAFFRHLDLVHVLGGDDRPRGTLEGIGKFNVRSYHKLFASLFREGDKGLSWRLVWKSRALLNVSFFTWEAALGRV